MVIGDTFFLFWQLLYYKALVAYESLTGVKTDAVLL